MPPAIGKEGRNLIDRSEKYRFALTPTDAEYGDMTKPSAFIGSSSEGLEFARACRALTGFTVSR
jgi:hypothetical protein